MDHEQSRNHPYSFKYGLETFTAMCSNVLQWHKSVYCLQEPHTKSETSQWTHWRCAVATTWTYRGLLEFSPYYSGFVPSTLRIFLPNSFERMKTCDRCASLVVHLPSASYSTCWCSQSVQNPLPSSGSWKTPSSAFLHDNDRIYIWNTRELCSELRSWHES
jgi:hypothetical protein